MQNKLTKYKIYYLSIKQFHLNFVLTFALGPLTMFPPGAAMIIVGGANKCGGGVFFTEAVADGGGGRGGRSPPFAPDLLLFKET